MKVTARAATNPRTRTTTYPGLLTIVYTPQEKKTKKNSYCCCLRNLTQLWTTEPTPRHKTAARRLNHGLPEQTPRRLLQAGPIRSHAFAQTRHYPTGRRSSSSLCVGLYTGLLPGTSSGTGRGGIRLGVGSSEPDSSLNTKKTTSTGMTLRVVSHESGEIRKTGFNVVYSI